MGPIVIKFIFDDAEVAENFLAHMSDGGGEWGVIESCWEHVPRVSLDFDYFSSPGNVIVTTSPREEYNAARYTFPEGQY